MVYIKIANFSNLVVRMEWTEVDQLWERHSYDNHRRITSLFWWLRQLAAIRNDGDTKVENPVKIVTF